MAATYEEVVSVPQELLSDLECQSLAGSDARIVNARNAENSDVDSISLSSETPINSFDFLKYTLNRHHVAHQFE
jgi:hypothetical protein